MKDRNLRIALAQINCTVGDLDGNVSKIKDYVLKAGGSGAEMVIFPELAVCGYPPEDLLLKPKFIQDNLSKIKELARGIGDTVVIAGFVDKLGTDLYNAAAVMYRGKIRGVYHKRMLPNYGVFDEKRYFKPGAVSRVFKFGEVVFGVNICEDIWMSGGPVREESLSGARMIININASPFHTGKIKQRETVIRRQARDNAVSVVYVNLVGGQDELVFDGQSMVVDARGRVVARGKAFQEDLLFVDLAVPAAKVRQRVKNRVLVAERIPGKEKTALSTEKSECLGPVAEVYQALLLGLRDYVRKNGFRKVAVGLSGGVDSALVAVLAADALGKENVSALFMPSRYSSRESAEDARRLADNLGINLIEISIEEVFKAYLEVLGPHFAGQEKNIAEENLQARIRGSLLMAFSNKFGWLILTTGNKSEMSTGYATLYGDMAGGFALIKDVPKMLVYELCRYRNTLKAVIPENILVKAPTAELKPDQKDSDTLPVYPELDPILKAYVEEDRDLEKIVALGFDRETVARVLGMVDKSEYKRRQSPPGIKITPKAFGRDRRMPITNRYGLR